ncbi:predicted protein [Naegleria gruberi]|uniref:Predicted protein n=1 Tax=Naegleria gruberi TaxID=5762 RepID=D2VF67_NAEGR|nr:uncharacterized protein NAEGRDRAFT_67518 [Naegleria gruberi]EFC44721.1 predicted protein [Naegleria gruberi]|eukprot:XP_002677465.1 predicted protein [Naegleria gruberi strain NEG-M]
MSLLQEDNTPNPNLTATGVVDAKPSEYTMAIMKAHPRKLMFYWLSCLLKFALSMVVFAVAINTFIALSDADELEKYDESLSKKLQIFMVIVSIINLLTAVFMMIGSIGGIIASLYPGSSNPQDSTYLHGSSAVGDFGASLGAILTRAEQNQYNPIYISKALRLANLRFYCSIVWFVCSILAVVFQVIRIILSAVGISVMHVMIERYKSMPELNIEADYIILILTALFALIFCVPFIGCSFVVMLRILNLRRQLSKQQDIVRDCVNDEIEHASNELEEMN